MSTFEIRCIKSFEGVSSDANAHSQGFYNALLRPHFEYVFSFEHLSNKKDAEALQSVQRRAMKL